MLEYIIYLVPYLIVLFSALWDVPYIKLKVNELYLAGEHNRVIWYRFMQHTGIYMFIIIMGLLVNWWVALIGIFLNWSGLQDLVWHWLLNIPSEDKQYFKNWTPLGLINRYITRVWKDERYYIPTKYYFTQMIIMFIISILLLII